VRRAENLQEPLLLRRVVVPLRRRDPDLGVQRNGAYGFFFQVLDAQLEEEARNGGIFENLGTLYPEIQVRHG
jgi:hypothetical protein